MSKPVVRYRERVIWGLGKKAFVTPIDHPKTELNGKFSTTSTVVAYDALSFETKNTRYVDANPPVLD